ncbi:MAG: hypothetical protein AB7P49_10180, partial [Bdellovibrionales bacterium]
LTMFGPGWVPATALADAKLRRNEQIEWEPVDDATLYEVQVQRKNADKQKPARFKTRDPSWSANIPPGIYLMQIRSYDARHVPGDWSPAEEIQVRLPDVHIISPTAGTVVPARKPDNEDVLLKWESLPGAKSYKVVIHSEDGKWEQTKEVNEPSLEVQIPVGSVYRWNVTAIDQFNEAGDAGGEDHVFELHGPPLEKPEIEKPRSKYVREVKWNPPPYTTRQTYQLFYRDPKKRKWEKVAAEDNVTQSRVELDISRPSGSYRLYVQAHGERRKPSPRARLDFQARGGFRSPAALENAILRDSIVKPTHFYAIASYLITRVDYKANNYDTGATSSFQALGGTGRIGLGYQDPESYWGGFGIADLSGFIIEKENFRFASAEVHLTRKMEFGQGGLLLFGTGVFSKEMPIVFGSEAEGFSGVGKVRNLGPHAGFIYWIPLNDRLGAQFNARAYYTLMGSASTGQSAQSSLSYQYGLLGSYRLGWNWMGYAGYVFRKDESAYEANSNDPESFALPGQINTISIQGHYLNLVLEFSF